MAETRRIDQHTEDETTLSRRNFLKLAWGTLGVAALGEGAWVTYRFLSPKVVTGEFGGVFTVGSVADFPPGSVTPVNAGRFYLIRLEDGGFLALYRKCTHLGCAVPWDQASGQFVCPCHASAFEVDGTVVNPPAPRPLDRFPVTIENDVITVDTGEPIQRDHAQPGDVVYAQEIPA